MRSSRTPHPNKEGTTVHLLRSKMVLLLAALAIFAAACGTEAADDTTDTSAAPTEEMAEDTTTEAASSAEICDPDGLVEAVESGPEDGTLAGMADDPVGTAASNNPVLTTLVTAVSEAGLVDTLNSAEALTVFAPHDCAFAQLDEETLNAALADPDGLLTTVLGFHVIAGQRLSAEELAEVDSLETFTGETLEVSGDADSLRVGGQAAVQVPDIQTANATVFLIDSVMLPPSVTGAMEGDETAAAASSAEICDPEGLVNAVEGGPSEGTLEGMSGDPVATAASNNPVLTTLVTAVGAAGLGDTLNSAEALTIFAPHDCAFAQLDEETLNAALADPEGLLTTVLGFHVVAGQRLSAEDLAGVDSLETFTGETLEVSGDADSLRVGGQAVVQVPDIQTANATVFLIDSVMLPPSVTGE
jgi:transforming growth factor-beta-induced protein